MRSTVESSDSEELTRIESRSVRTAEHVDQPPDSAGTISRHQDSGLLLGDRSGSTFFKIVTDARVEPPTSPCGSPRPLAAGRLVPPAPVARPAVDRDACGLQRVPNSPCLIEVRTVMLRARRQRAMRQGCSALVRN